MEGDDNWDEHIESVHRLLSFFGQRILDQANLYNAMKHGFAVQASSSRSVNIVNDREQTLASAEGPSISYLEIPSDGPGKGRWHDTTTWISPDRGMAVTGVAILLIQTLWAINRARYTGGQPEPGRTYVFNRSHVDAVVPMEGGIPASMSRELHYEG